MTVHGFTTIRDYAHFVEKNPYELDSLFGELIIGVTSFFRDAEAFEALESELEHRKELEVALEDLRATEAEHRMAQRPQPPSSKSMARARRPS